MLLVGAAALAVLLLHAPAVPSASAPAGAGDRAEEANGAALFLRACQALEANRLDEAQELLARLQASLPGRPELQILDRLIAHRRGLLSSGWGQAFVDAWAELGRPNLHDSPLLPPFPAEPGPEFNEQALKHASTAEARSTLLLALEPIPQELAQWLLQQPPEQVEPALALALLEPRALNAFPEDLRAEAQALLRQSVELLSRGSPRAIQPRLMLLLSGTEPGAPLNRQEMEALESLSSLPTWRAHSFSETSLRARRPLQEAGAPSAGFLAFSLAERTVGALTVHLLERRADATWARLQLDDQRWLGRSLWLIGQRVAESSSYLEQSSGTALMETGSFQMGQQCDQLDNMDRRETFVEHLRIATGAALERWPLPSLVDELQSSRARHERTFLRALAGHASLP